MKKYFVCTLALLLLCQGCGTAHTPDEPDAVSSCSCVIERGVKAPKLETFVSIANALEVSADSLLFDVVNHSSVGVANDTSARIAKLPKQEQIKILKILDAFTI